MIKEAGILFGLLVFSFGSQTVNAEKCNTIERPCGKVEWLQRIPVKGNTSSYDEKRRAIKKAEVRLYRREKSVPCCGESSPVAQATSGKDGIFELGSVAPGNYWIVILAEGKQYSLAVSYAADPKKRDQVSCSDLLYDLTGEELQLGRMITVD